MRKASNWWHTQQQVCHLSPHSLEVTADTHINNTGYSAVLTDPLIVELAAKYGVTPAQIVLAWHLARGVGIVPKSAHPQRQKDNLNVSRGPPAATARDFPWLY